MSEQAAQGDLYLSYLRLNPRNRLVQENIADCHRLHRTVMDAFPVTGEDRTRATFGILYRPEIDPRTGLLTLLVQSQFRPDWSTLPGNDDTSQPFLARGDAGATRPDVKRIAAAYRSLTPGMLLAFRLRANPTKRLGQKGDPARQDPLAGKRVALLSEEERLVWLARKAATNGCAIETAEVRPDGIAGATLRGRKEDDARGRAHTLTFGAVVFDGMLRVTDPRALFDALAQGIGSGKAYGFGLLSIAPAPC
jgi:CRISPR system Cascade subunit CasE